MPIFRDPSDPPGVIRTRLSGRVTDEELLAYYFDPSFLEVRGGWREIVDGTGISWMAVTAAGQRRLADLATLAAEQLRGGRVAMVAGSLVTYGMFRMWQMRREGLGYEVRVFRSLPPAIDWVTG